MSSLRKQDINPRNKELLRRLSPENFTYLGYWDNLYHYQKQLHDGKSVELKVNVKDFIDGHIEMMVKNGYSRA